MKSYYIYKITLVLSLSLIGFLIYDKPKVSRFIVTEDSHIRRPTGNDIYVYYVLRKAKKEFRKLDEYKFEQNLLLKHNDNDVYFDYTDYNSLEVADKLDKTYFSKLKNLQCFIFDVSCVKVQKLKHLLQFEYDDNEPARKKSKDPDPPGGQSPQDNKKSQIPSPPPPPPPEQQAKQNPLPNKPKNQKVDEGISLQDNLIYELKNRIKKKEKKLLDEQLKDEKILNPKSLHEVVNKRRNAISMSSESEVEELEESSKPVLIDDKVDEKPLQKQPSETNDFEKNLEVNVNEPRILSSKLFLDELEAKVEKKAIEKSQVCADTCKSSDNDFFTEKKILIDPSIVKLNENRDEVKDEYAESLTDSNYETMSDKSTDLNNPIIVNDSDSEKSKLELIEEKIAYYKQIKEMERVDKNLDGFKFLIKASETNLNSKFEEEEKSNLSFSENEWSD